MKKGVYADDRYKVILAFVLIGLCLLFLSGCTLDALTKVAETGSKSYKTISNANSISKAVDAGEKIAETRKIKAETNKLFIEKTETLIANQPIEKQAELISQSIEAKVEIAKNRSFDAFILGVLSLSLVIFIIKIIAWIWDRISPRIAKKEYQQK